jgi:hypothetical protein
MTRALAVLALMLSTAACSKHDDARPKKEGLVPQLEALADQACACKDHACAIAAGEQMTTLGKTVQPDEIPSADLPKLQAAQSRLEACQAKLDPRVTAYIALADEVCACKDAKCAQGVADKIEAWSDDVRGSKEPIPGGLDAIRHDGLRANACLKKFDVDVPR